MASFKALNIESDDESDVEIDDTKEIQIEDALKLYQTALRYHASGPASFEKAAEAYRELFESDIFKYPESQTELGRDELYDTEQDLGNAWLDELDVGPVASAGALDSGPSTLPQILHLAHKNYAQFKLEHLEYRLEAANETLKYVLGDAVAALDHFVDALDKDDADLDLWRKTASIGTALNSTRIARFCLEAVLDGDDESLANLWSTQSLEEGLAAEQLRDLVAQLGDRLSILQDPLSSSQRRVLSRFLKERLKLYDDLGDRIKALKSQDVADVAIQTPVRRVTLKAPSSWAEFGDLMIQQFLQEQQNASPVSCAAISFMLPSHQEMSAGEPTTPVHGVTPAEMEMVDTHAYLTQYPLTVDEQFPGLDHGLPTTQPQIAPAFLRSKSDSTKQVHGNESSAVALPTRKRSGDSAGLGDTTEEGRTKSKRIRARDSNIDPETSRQALLDANARWELQMRLDELQALDDWMFKTGAKVFEKVGVRGFDEGSKVREEIRMASEGQAPAETPSDDAFGNLRGARLNILNFLQGFTDRLANVILKDNEGFKISTGPFKSESGSASNPNVASSGTTSITPVPDHSIPVLLARINAGWFTVQEAAWEWLIELLQPSHIDQKASSYMSHQWPDTLKTNIVRVLVNFDDWIFPRANAILHGSGLKESNGSFIFSSRSQPFADVIETIFELHLDIYTLIQQPNSGVSGQTVAQQLDRLQRWAELTREVMFKRKDAQPTSDPKDQLQLRFLWTTTFYLAVSPDVTQEHVIACMEDLAEIYSSAGAPTIHLPNNAVTPELSITALHQEKAKLMTKDFFLKNTSPELGDPVDVIHSLEPLLIYIEQKQSEDTLDQEAALANGPGDASPELVQFLMSSEMSVKLVLWERLQDAYRAIEYEPMVVCCYFHMLRLVLAELKAMTNLTDLSANDRQILVLRLLKRTHSILRETFLIMHGSTTALDCIDARDLCTAVTSLAQVLQLLQVVNVFEDSIRVGKLKPPSQPNGLSLPSWSKVMAMFHDAQIQTWMLLYWLLKEAIDQNPGYYDTPLEDQFDFLCAVHRNLGNRGICSASNRAFVRMLKDEFLTMTHVEHYESEQAQVLYDLYGLNCFLNPTTDLTEHNCRHDAFIGKTAAIQAVDLVLVQASKLPMKELIKHTLKDTIDRIHGSVTRKKPTEAILRNREIYRAFLKSPINRLDLFDCLRGQGNELPISPVPAGDALLAAKGWYFFMGHISLTKFRSQKRTAPAPTEDVDIAIAFFNQDLEYSMDNWETWFRLAQAYDTKIEESVVWSAEKLNSNMSELVQLQRAAIHCYTVATALANRSATIAFETSDKMTELYFEFANRLYATSRAPFNMLPFAVDDREKFLSAASGIEMSPSFPALRLYTAWKLAKVLYQRASTNKSYGWTLPYNTAKCLWKMYTASADVRGSDRPVPLQQVLDSVIQAIDAVPADKKDSREKREPTLEPHYKLASLVHKLVWRQEMSLEQAKDVLKHTKYAPSNSFPTKRSNWMPYILLILKNLRTADKANWHHRMIARSAHIIFQGPLEVDGSDVDADSDLDRATKAKQELMQQLFTKTMVLQVWRPESERAGRHFVYYARYTRFFVKILEMLGDRASLEQLARRIRRRSHDVFEHVLVWSDLCIAYLRLLRKHAQIPEGLEIITFNNIAHEEFLARKEGLERWMQTQDVGTSAPLDVLREVHEMKKINQALARTSFFDDLIGDTYAQLFVTVGKQLWEDEKRIKLEEEAKRSVPIMSPPRNPAMSLTNLLTNEGDEETRSNGAAKAVPITSSSLTAAADVPTTSADPPSRIKNRVGRREIRLCAEACFQKAPLVPTKESTKSQTPGTRVQVVIEVSRTPKVSDSFQESSAPASVHDSADDDESELSELEEIDADDEGSDGDDEAEDNDEEPSRIEESAHPDVDDSPTDGGRIPPQAKGFETVNEAGSNAADTAMVDAGEDAIHDGEEDVRHEQE